MRCNLDQKRSVPGRPEQHSERRRRAKHLRSGRTGQHLHTDETDRPGRQSTADQNQPLLVLHETGQVKPAHRHHNEVTGSGRRLFS